MLLLLKMFSIFLAMSRRHLFCGGECSKWVLGYPGVSDARGPVQLGERRPAAEGEVYRFFLEKLLLGERKTSGC